MCAFVGCQNSIKRTDIYDRDCFFNNSRDCLDNCGCTWCFEVKLCFDSTEDRKLCQGLKIQEAICTTKYAEDNNTFWSSFLEVTLAIASMLAFSVVIAIISAIIIEIIFRIAVHYKLSQNINV